MGTSISIDKHVSSLEDILEMSPSYFDKIKFESKISPDITQHLKVNDLITKFMSYRYGSSWKIRGNLKMWRAPRFPWVTYRTVDSISRPKRLIYYYWYTRPKMKVISNRCNFIQPNATLLPSPTVFGELCNPLKISPREVSPTPSHPTRNSFNSTSWIPSCYLSVGMNLVAKGLERARKTPQAKSNHS